MTAERLELGTVALCRTCRKAIGELKGYPEIGWLHFATHDGHTPAPLPSRPRIRQVGVPGGRDEQP